MTGLWGAESQVSVRSLNDGNYLWNGTVRILSILSILYILSSRQPGEARCPQLR